MTHNMEKFVLTVNKMAGGRGGGGGGDLFATNTADVIYPPYWQGGGEGGQLATETDAQAVYYHGSVKVALTCLAH